MLCHSRKVTSAQFLRVNLITYVIIREFLYFQKYIALGHTGICPHTKQANSKVSFQDNSLQMLGQYLQKGEALLPLHPAHCSSNASGRNISYLQHRRLHSRRKGRQFGESLGHLTLPALPQVATLRISTIHK